MSEVQMRRRDRVASWVQRRGVDIGEIVSIGASIIYAWRAIDVRNGVPVAPLTWNLFVRLNEGVLFWVLVFNGLAVFIALLSGWITGNTFRYRSMVSLGSSCVWIIIAIAAWGADMPASVTAGYFFTCSISWLTALILSLKAAYARAARKLEMERVS